ncbi:MAG: DUF938 domain-containing protein, partial [Myxococcota bacterium]
LEVASGTGQHAAFFADALPRLTWQPTDPSAEQRASTAAYVAEAGLANLRAPLALDARSATWPVAAADAVLCINMFQVSPLEAAEGLFAGAARVLGPAGVLVTYGPYREHGAHTSPGNTAFDGSLRERNPTWGVRDVEGELVPRARAAGLALAERVAMPANNLSLVWRPLT